MPNTIDVDQLNYMAQARHLVQQGHSLHLNKNKKWVIDGALRHTVRWLRGKENLTVVSIVQRMGQLLDDLERRESIKFFSHSTSNEAIEYRKKFKVYLAETEEVIKLAEGIKGSSTLLKESCGVLKCKQTSLLYRLEQNNGGLKKRKKPDRVLLKKLMEAAQTWKKNQTLATKKELNELEIEQLEQAACYREWTCRLLETKDYQKEFFNWALRDYNPVNICVEFPGVQKTIRKSLLSAPLGKRRLPGEKELITLEKKTTKRSDINKKVVTLPFKTVKCTNGRAEKINILKNKTITLEGNYRVKVDDFFHMQSQKNKGEVNINLSGNQFVNFHATEHGYWDADQKRYVTVDFNDPNWVYKVPVQETVTVEQLKNEYKNQEDLLKIIQENGKFASMASTRQALNLSSILCHGFCEFSIPNTDKKTYRLIAFGKYADRFAVNKIDGPKMFAGTYDAKISVNDMSGSLTYRQTALSPIPMSAIELDRFIERVISAFKKKIFFQFSGSNCAHFPETQLKKVKPDAADYFKMSIFKGTTSIGPLDKFLAWLDKRSLVMQKIGLQLILLVFIGFRGKPVTKGEKKKLKSVFNYYRKQEQIEGYSPAYLHYQIEKGKLPGAIYWGNTERKIARGIKRVSKAVI